MWFKSYMHEQLTAKPGARRSLVIVLYTSGQTISKFISNQNRSSYTMRFNSYTYEQLTAKPDARRSLVIVSRTNSQTISKRIGKQNLIIIYRLV